MFILHCRRSVPSDVLLHIGHQSFLVLGFFFNMQCLVYCLDHYMWGGKNCPVHYDECHKGIKSFYDAVSLKWNKLLNWE